VFRGRYVRKGMKGRKGSEGKSGKGGVLGFRMHYGERNTMFPLLGEAKLYIP
jgi:hypothetical protein